MKLEKLFYNNCYSTHLIDKLKINEFGNKVILVVPSFGFPTRLAYSSFTRVINLKTYFLALSKKALSSRTGSKINISHYIPTCLIDNLILINANIILVVIYSWQFSLSTITSQLQM